MCYFDNDRYTRCGHEQERGVLPCTAFTVGAQSKFCPNSKDNTINTYINELCASCKDPHGGPPVPVFPEYDYARLTVRRVYGKGWYAKQGEKHVPRGFAITKESEMINEPGMTNEPETTKEPAEHDQKDKGKLKVPESDVDDEEAPDSMASSWIDLGAEDDLEGEGVIVDLLEGVVDEDLRKLKLKSKQQKKKKILKA